MCLPRGTEGTSDSKTQTPGPVVLLEVDEIEEQERRQCKDEHTFDFDTD